MIEHVRTSVPAHKSVPLCVVEPTTTPSYSDNSVPPSELVELLLSYAGGCPARTDCPSRAHAACAGSLIHSREPVRVQKTATAPSARLFATSSLRETPGPAPHLLVARIIARRQMYSPETSGPGTYCTSAEAMISRSRSRNCHARSRMSFGMASIRPNRESTDAVDFAPQPGRPG